MLLHFSTVLIKKSSVRRRGADICHAPPSPRLLFVPMMMNSGLQRDIYLHFRLLYMLYGERFTYI
jgi:hypothetical protein